MPKAKSTARDFLREREELEAAEKTRRQAHRTWFAEKMEEAGLDRVPMALVEERLMQLGRQLRNKPASGTTPVPVVNASPPSGGGYSSAA